MLRIKLIILFLFLLLILFVRLWTFYQNQTTYKDGEMITFEARLTDEPEFSNGQQKFRLLTPKGKKVNIRTSASPILQYGDRVKIRGKIDQRTYNGYKYLAMNFPKLEKVKNNENWIIASATNIRRNASSLYQSALPPTSASLLLGIIFGGNQGLPDDFLDNLRSTGVVHVIAASGMNVTFVAGALIFALSKILKRQIALLLAILGVLFYAFLAGFDPSIVRASIMAVIAFTASLFGRQNMAIGSLFLTGFIMLFFAPNNLQDVGFQLSFLATLGILVIKPLIDQGFAKLGLLGKIGRDDIGTTIAAQVGTLPILLGTFGNFGLLSVLVNALVLFTIPVLMILGSVGLLAGFIYAPIGKLFLFLTIPILLYFEKTIMFFGDLGWMVTVSEVSVFVWVGYYLLLAAVIYFAKIKNKR